MSLHIPGPFLLIAGALIIISLSELSTCSPDQPSHEMIKDRIEYGDESIERAAAEIAKEYPGDYTINQVCAIFDALNPEDGGGWPYKEDPKDHLDPEKIRYANDTLQYGRAIGFQGQGDCDDYAILMASLIENLRGTARINFVYVPRGTGHAYTEVYLGKNGNASTTELIEWLMRKYQINKLEINYSLDEVWLNLDYSRWSKDGPVHPGGPYFPYWPGVQIGGDLNNLILRPFIRDPSNKIVPKIIPVVDLGTAWTEKVKKGSAISIKSINQTTSRNKPSKKVIEVSYNLTDGGWASISMKPKPEIFSEVFGLKFKHIGGGSPNTIELRLVADKTDFGVSWNGATSTDGLSSHQALFSDFDCLSPAKNCKDRKLDPAKISKIQLNISNHPDLGDMPGEGVLIIYEIEGVMHIPTGSVWAQIEEERKKDMAIQLVRQSESLRAERADSLYLSALLGVEAIKRNSSWETDQALRKALELMPTHLFSLTHSGYVHAIKFSPDKRYIATLSNNETLMISSAIIWDRTTGEELARLNPQDDVHNLEISPDGRFIATAGWDKDTFNHMLARDMASFKDEGDIEGFEEYRKYFEKYIGDFEEYIEDLSDNETTERDTIWIWNSTTRAQVISRKDSEGSVLAIKFSPDGKYLAVISKNETDSRKVAWIRNATTLSQVARLDQENISDVEFSHDGNFLATINDGIITVWNITNFKKVSSLNVGEALGFVISPDKKYIVTLDLHSLKLFDILSGEEILKQEITGYDSGSISGIIRIDKYGNYLATSSDSYKATLWEMPTLSGSCWSQFREVITAIHDRKITALEFSPDGRYLATSSLDGTARVWETKTGGEFARMIHENGGIEDICFSANGEYLATAGNDNRARIWKVNNGKEMQINHNSFIHHVLFSPDGKYLVTAGSNTARIWEMPTGKEKAEIVHDGEITALDFGSEGKYLATSSANTSWIWGMTNGSSIEKKMDDKLVEGLGFSKDSKYLAISSYISWSKDITESETISGTTLTIRILENGTRDVAEMTHELSDISYSSTYPSIYCIPFIFSPDGKYIASAILNPPDGIVWFLNITANKELEPIVFEGIKQRYGSQIQDISISPDWKYVAYAINNTAWIIHLKNQRKFYQVIHHDIIEKIGFSQNGKYFVAKGDNTIGIWDASTGNNIFEIIRENKIYDYIFSPDDRFIATASLSTSGKSLVSIWNVTTGTEVARLAHDYGIQSMDFSSDGKYLAIASGNAAHLWLWRPNDLIAEACSRVGRSLTRNEWQRYVGDEPFHKTCS